MFRLWRRTTTIGWVGGCVNADARRRGGTARAATLLATLAQGTSLGISARSTAHLDYRGTSLIAGSSSQDFTGTVGHGTWSGSAVRAEEVAAAYRRAIDLASATTAFGSPWVVSVVLKPYNHMRHMGLWLQSSATPRPKDARIDPHARAVGPRSSYRTARPPSRFAPPLLTFRALDPQRAKCIRRFSISQCTSSSSAGTFWISSMTIWRPRASTAASSSWRRSSGRIAYRRNSSLFSRSIQRSSR